jgi:hypothetical protein
VGYLRLIFPLNLFLILLLVGLLVAPIDIAQRFSAYNLNFTALIRAVAAPFLNAGAAAGRPFAISRGGSSGPVSSAPRARQRGGPAMRGSARRTGNLPISLASIV